MLSWNYIVIQRGLAGKLNLFFYIFILTGSCLSIVFCKIKGKESSGRTFVRITAAAFFFILGIQSLGQISFLRESISRLTPQEIQGSRGYSPSSEIFDFIKFCDVKLANDIKAKLVIGPQYDANPHRLFLTYFLYPKVVFTDNEGAAVDAYIVYGSSETAGLFPEGFAVTHRFNERSFIALRKE